MSRFHEENIISGVIIDESTTFTLVEVCEKCQLREEILLQMIEHGLIEPVKTTTETLFLDLEALHRIQAAIRLQQDLDINLAGAAMVLELLDELNVVHNELAMLQKHLKQD